MIKDAFEDYQRHKSDKDENEKLCLVYDHAKKEFVSMQWQNIRPGMLVKVKDDEFFPADMIVL